MAETIRSNKLTIFLVLCFLLAGTIARADLDTWHARRVGNAVENIVFGNGTFVAAAANNGIVTSPDGFNWTLRDPGPLGYYNDVAFDGTSFVAVNGEGDIVTSPDGVTWTLETSPPAGQFFGVTRGGSTWVVVGDSGTVMTSPDGTNWTSQTSGISERLQSVAHNGTAILVRWGHLDNTGVRNNESPVICHLRWWNVCGRGRCWDHRNLQRWSGLVHPDLGHRH
jgi:hypothetical protein